MEIHKEQELEEHVWCVCKLWLSATGRAPGQHLNAHTLRHGRYSKTEDLSMLYKNQVGPNKGLYVMQSMVLYSYMGIKHNITLLRLCSTPQFNTSVS